MSKKATKGKIKQVFFASLGVGLGIAVVVPSITYAINIARSKVGV